MTRLDYERIPPRPPRPAHDPISMLGISLFMAFAFAVIYVVVMTLTLPPTDLAYGQKPFQDPLVLPVMSVIASVCGLLAFPFFYLSCRHLPLAKSTLIVMAVTIAVIVFLTPIDAGMGLLGSFAGFALGLALAKKILGSNPRRS